MHQGLNMDPDEARAAMVARLRAAGVVSSPAVDAALSAVPRHHFIDDVSIEFAYAETAVVVKRAAGGRALSSASQPAIVGSMLEMAAIEPGHRLLEVGTGTGYNAALLAHLVGTQGMVVTIELDADLAAAARRRLDDLGCQQVEVVVGDGAAGWRNAAPFDRIIVTAGAAEVAGAWVEQLRPGGRLVVPLVNAAGRGTLRCLVSEGGRLRELASMACGFVPLRPSPSEPEPNETEPDETGPDASGIETEPDETGTGTGTGS
ncbi:MAG: methyltransferase domain-containing protein [Actinomycetota bacterium]